MRAPLLPSIVRADGAPRVPVKLQLPSRGDRLAKEHHCGGSGRGARDRRNCSGRICPGQLKVGFVYLGPVGDFGWTYQHEVGRQHVVKELGSKVETTYLENVNEGPDSERAIEQLADRKSVV